MGLACMNLHVFDICWTGDKTIQCGRKADAIKWWLMWKARGDAGMTYIVENAYQKAA